MRNHLLLLLYTVVLHLSRKFHLECLLWCHILLRFMMQYVEDE